MQSFDAAALRAFYTDHLKNRILSFWMPRCLDAEDGGYLNCFDNRGERLMSTDKFTWSQGRFVWTFSALASTPADIFTDGERETFLRYARSGVEFLEKHALLPDAKTPTCTYLTDKKGAPIRYADQPIYDASIYADFFVIGGFARYAFATGDAARLDFAKRLYASARDRIARDDYRVLPYVRPAGRKMHGIPMISLNTATDLLLAGRKLGDGDGALLADIGEYVDEILGNFLDDKNRIHEIITVDNAFTDDLPGRHINPGHSIEDVWFLLDGLEALGDGGRAHTCRAIAKTAFDLGWDQEYGGILLYVDEDGGPPKGAVPPGMEKEDTVVRLRNNWTSKLFWVHSEALYTLLRCFVESGESVFWADYAKLHDYVFSTFPNPDAAIGEWIQNRRRDGQPEDRLVALPVKDPFHITRNLLKIIELLEKLG